jgi:superfamily II DNA or RNA helicase
MVVKGRHMTYCSWTAMVEYFYPTLILTHTRHLQETQNHQNGKQSFSDEQGEIKNITEPQ